MGNHEMISFVFYYHGTLVLKSSILRPQTSFYSKITLSAENEEKSAAIDLHVFEMKHLNEPFLLSLKLTLVLEENSQLYVGTNMSW